MSDKDYYSFDEVISDLRMEEDELKRLVSAGEIRAFRDQDTMRFKAEDIERLRGGDEGGDDLDLDMDLDMADDDALVLEDDGPTEVDLAAPAKPARGARKSAAAATGAGAPQRRTPRSAAAAEPEGSEGPGTLFALVLGVIVLLFANFAAFGAVSGRTNQLTDFLAGFFRNN
ncbi:MAG: hypothetical protein DHS20C15_03510 [Planctomycetota bacterium]|nr:MAG: hypothetical protein DHS20C15_03510 [Planctomycetota bacterium]